MFLTVLKLGALNSTGVCILPSARQTGSPVFRTTFLITKHNLRPGFDETDLGRLLPDQKQCGHKPCRADSVQIHPAGSRLSNFWKWERGEKGNLHFYRCYTRLSINCPAADSTEFINSIHSHTFGRNSIKCNQFFCAKRWLQDAPQVNRLGIWCWMVVS